MKFIYLILQITFFLFGIYCIFVYNNAIIFNPFTGVISLLLSLLMSIGITNNDDWSIAERIFDTVVNIFKK